MIIENISVVIPTHKRPDLVGRAIDSVLSQTFKDIEVIVVIDGPDSHTTKVLEQISDPRLKVIALAENAGVSEARNSGVRVSRYEWIAFLDDDDQWMPEKLEKQIKAAINLNKALPIISCCSQYQGSRTSKIRPLKFPKSSEHISDYLFAKTSFFGGHVNLQTSTILTKKELLEALPFRKHLWRCEDWDFFLRAAQLEEVCFEVVPEPLIIYNILDNREHLSNKDDVEFSLQWIRDNRNLFTPRAYAGYLAKNISAEARRQKKWKYFVPLLREMFLFGQPKLVELTIYLSNWFIPEEAQQWIKNIVKTKLQ